jgi:hypothetical protein
MNLKKSKKTPLFMPEMSTPIPLTSVSAYDNPPSGNIGDSLNTSHCLSPFGTKHLNDIKTNRDEFVSSSLSSYSQRSGNYLPQIGRRDMTNKLNFFSLEKSQVPAEIQSSRVPFKSQSKLILSSLKDLIFTFRLNLDFN